MAAPATLDRDTTTAGASMRAVRLDAAGCASVVRAPAPQPGPGEVRVRIAGSGVCASSIPLWEGRPWFDYPRPPGEPGHEGWGWIDELGDEVEGLSTGTPVACLSFHAFAEYDLAPATDVVPLHGWAAGLPFPGEAFGCAANVVARARITGEDTVVVIGVGFLGAVIVRLAAAAGARVIACSRRPFARRLAERLGAAESVAMDDHARVVGAVRELTGGDGAGCVIEATGAQWPLDVAAEVAAESGRLVIAGYHQDGARQVNMQLWNWRAFDIINAHERDARRNVAGIAAAAAAVRDGTLDPSDFVTHVYPLDRAGEALQATRDKPDEFLKAVVTL